MTLNEIHLVWIICTGNQHPGSSNSVSLFRRVCFFLQFLICKTYCLKATDKYIFGCEVQLFWWLHFFLLYPKLPNTVYLKILHVAWVCIVFHVTSLLRSYKNVEITWLNIPTWSTCSNRHIELSIINTSSMP